MVDASVGVRVRLRMSAIDQAQLGEQEALHRVEGLRAVG